MSPLCSGLTTWTVLQAALFQGKLGPGGNPVDQRAARGRVPGRLGKCGVPDIVTALSPHHFLPECRSWV
jgi:hypothetical protein